jgi:molybdopterin-guanine dinucleotide biosynthesis protein A
MTGIILAGGENRRMGRDKAFLSIAGRPMIEHVLAAFRAVVGRIFIVTNAPGRYGGYAVTAVTDAFDTRGPLTGIYSGMAASDDEYHFVAACDMPFLEPGLMRFMAGLADGPDAVVPLVGGQYEPLLAIYHHRLLPLMEDRIRRGVQRVQALYDGLDLRPVTEEEIRRFDPGKRSFINLNTPAQYKEVSCSDSDTANCSSSC